MPEIINPPPILSGEEKQQIQQLRSYLFSVSEAINRNMQMIGGNELSDRERAAVQGIIQTGSGLEDVASLRDMVVRLAESVKKALAIGPTWQLQNEVTSGRFGQYVLGTTANVSSDLDGHVKAEAISNVLQKQRLNDLTLRNCIYAGQLRDGVTGVAIGKNVVTFAQDGTETFHPENTMIEITNGGDVNVPGALRGGNAATTATDFNSITTDGTYWVNVASMSNKPADLASGTCLLEVNNTTGIIRQRLEAASAVYIRRNTSSSWGSWIKYAGT